MRMADRIALLKDGRLAQLGTAEELYYAPVDLFVAGFFSELNIFRTRVKDGHADTPLGCFKVDDGNDSEELTLAVRLSGIGLKEKGGATQARIVYRRFLGDFEQFALSISGSDTLVHARMPAGTLKSDLRDVTLYVNERDILMFK